MEVKFQFSSEQINLLRLFKEEILIGIRPEDISVEKNIDNIIEIEALTDFIEPMGNETFIYFEIEKIQFIARVKPLQNLKSGDKIKLYVDPKKYICLIIKQEII